ncbi:unnamed protein product [Parnassius apollo]|uniref:(apollo) hypothetical protein n=1 Tax=Parnassius apollo TaxID=110799 RepID=A0A8S3WLC9_PARAO|nr:unnamed protein product [Parnassius apollo]
MIKIDKKDIVTALRSVFTKDYLQRLANAIAGNAAKRFVEVVMKNLELQRNDEFERSMNEKASKHSKGMNGMGKRNILQLLKKPSPDGDNLDSETGISKEQTDDDKEQIPVIGVMKINGVYYRRLLGLL